VGLVVTLRQWEQVGVAVTISRSLALFAGLLGFVAAVLFYARRWGVHIEACHTVGELETCQGQASPPWRLSCRRAATWAYSRSYRGRNFCVEWIAHRRRNSVYTMRMARVNITLPDDLLNQARAAGLNVSRLAAAALAEELDRRAKINELDAYLADLDNELGPVPQHELKAAREWADAILPAGRDGTGQARSA
jgi:hypothetical protein